MSTGEMSAATLAQYRQWAEAGDEFGPAEALDMLNHITALTAEVERFAKFKALTHATLDALGAPTFDDADCRIAKRLEWITAEVERLKGERDEALHDYKNAADARNRHQREIIEKDAQLERLRAAVERGNAALIEADRLYSSYGLKAEHADCGAWINSVREAIRSDLVNGLPSAPPPNARS